MNKVNGKQQSNHVSMRTIRMARGTTHFIHLWSVKALFINEGDSHFPNMAGNQSAESFFPVRFD